MSTITHRCSFWLIRNAFWELWRSSTLTPLPEELQSDLGKRAPCWGVGCCDFSRSRFKFSHTVRKLGCVLRGIFKARVVTSSPTLAPKSSRFSKNSSSYSSFYSTCTIYTPESRHCPLSSNVTFCISTTVSAHSKCRTTVTAVIVTWLGEGVVLSADWLHAAVHTQICVCM